MEQMIAFAVWREKMEKVFATLKHLNFVHGALYQKEKFGDWRELWPSLEKMFGPHFCVMCGRKLYPWPRAIARESYRDALAYLVTRPCKSIETPTYWCVPCSNSPSSPYEFIFTVARAPFDWRPKSERIKPKGRWIPERYNK
jgi:hypothetical protein